MVKPTAATIAARTGTRNKMKPQYFLPGDVWDAALARMHWVFEEFDDNVVVATSGGKDSTVVLELAALVNEQRGYRRGPLRAHFLDQEAEYEATIDYQRYVMNERPDIDLTWYQIPFRLFNATSHTSQWAKVWDPALSPSQWIRPKEPNSIHDNPFTHGRPPRPVDRFKDCLHHMLMRYPDAAHIAGLRVEESPTRRVLMTGNASYKWVTWASGNGRDKPWQFYPVYDWSHRDVWHAIESRGWRYNTFYDAMYRYGVPLTSMRVSSFHHEQSMKVLDYLAELEPATWERATRRLSGVNTYAHVGEELYAQYLNHLPHLFSSWLEYLEHLIENLVESSHDKAVFRGMLARTERDLPEVPRREIARVMVRMVIFNDLYGSNLHSWADAQRYPVRQLFWINWKREQAALGNYSPAEEEGRASVA